MSTAIRCAAGRALVSLVYDWSGCSRYSIRLVGLQSAFYKTGRAAVGIVYNWPGCSRLSYTAIQAAVGLVYTAIQASVG